jgi:thiamine-phosphate pyrophosphorylase
MQNRLETGPIPRARDRTGLMIVIENPEATSAGERLRAALATYAVSCVLLAEPQDASFDASPLAGLVAAAQEAGAAALLENDAPSAKLLRADGIHLRWSKNLRARYEEARSTMGAAGVVGIDAGVSRHDAMVLGEAGADYVGFGLEAHRERGEVAREHRLELIGWWSEIFEIPCVAFGVSGPHEAQQLVEAGADFLAIDIRPTASAVDAAKHLKEIADVLPRGT